MTPAPSEPKGNYQRAALAVQIFLDRAISAMEKNDGITPNDWVWYESYLKEMLQRAKEKINA